MQFIESSVIGIRSAVITLTHRTTPLRFILFPMVHVAEQQFYDEVAARARLCQLIVAEGVPSKFAPAQEWMAQQRWGDLVDEVAALRLESLGVPVRWEAELDDQPKSLRDQLMSRATDVAGAATIGLARKLIDPRGVLPSVDQAEDYEESALNLTGGWFNRMLEYHFRTVRDARLARMLDEIHHDRAAEPVTAGVVFGAGHMPAVAAHLCGQLGYFAASAEWLTVAHARSLVGSLLPTVSWSGRRLADLEPGQLARQYLKGSEGWCRVNGDGLGRVAGPVPAAPPAGVLPVLVACEGLKSR
jgi:hypothetical protein